jgi:DNA-binding GntR family transcriptional regulator
VSTVRALAGTIRRRVLAGVYPPLGALREVAIAAEFGVARNSVRAALQALVHEGLLRHAPNRGVFVPQLTRDDIEDIFRLRIALEVEAVRVAALVKADHARARSTIAELAKVGPHDRAAAIELDLQFHDAIVADAGSAHLTRAYDALESEIRLSFAQWGFSYETPRLIAAEHERLLAVIDAAGTARAPKAMREHLEATMWTMLSSAPDATLAPGRPDDRPISTDG